MEKLFLGGIIKKARKAKRLSQQVLAERIESSNGYISEIETGKKSPGSEILFRLSRELDVPLESLRIDEGQMEKTGMEGDSKDFTNDLDIVNDVTFILKKGSESTRNALIKNVHEFRRMVETDEKMTVCEEELKNLRADFEDMKKQLEGLSAPPTSVEGSAG